MRICGWKHYFLRIIDILLAMISVCIAVLMVGDELFSGNYFIIILSGMVIQAVVYCVTFYMTGIYKIVWYYASLMEVIRLIISSVFSQMISYVIHFTISKAFLSDVHNIEFLKIHLVCGTAATVLIVTSRVMLYYIERERQIKNVAGFNNEKNNTMIIGAGDACRVFTYDMKTNYSDEYNIKCIIDDDVSKHGLVFNGIPVVGNRYSIPENVEKYNIKNIVFAIPSCPEDAKMEILNICTKTNCVVKTMPSVHQVIHEEFGREKEDYVKQIRNVEIEDLLGRSPIKTDLSLIMDYVSDKVVLVTGGGGSIGSELCRQIAAYRPKQLIIFDVYENNAYDIQQELVLEYGTKLNLVTLISSVRDYDKMELIFKTYRPELVFHAAAHKHVPLMETVPEEAVKNNIFGTFNVATLAEKYKAKKFVMISTDKAVNPTNVMGATKRACEMIIQYKAQHSTDTEFVTTRFGNVLGSNGSVIPLFRRQIENGAPVTVTHPDIIRYFMTIPEAVSLVLEAGAMAKGGEIFVLDMGAPVKITTLAENLIRMYGKVPYKDVPIIFTGLRPGEKLFEELLMDEEGLKSTQNKKIFIGNQIKIDETDMLSKLEVLKKTAENNDSEKTVELLAELVPTFCHKVND